LDEVVDSVPPDKGCEVLAGELTHEKWGENDSENFADSDDAHILLKWGGHYKMLLGVKNFKKYNVSPYNEVQMSLLLISKASMS